MNFSNLHNHTMYSLLDGYGSAEQYVQRAVEIVQEAIGITDHGTVDGTIKFQRACKKAGIKSVIGSELYIVPDMYIKNKGEKRGHITVLVKGIKGWRLLLSWLSKANIDGFYRKPRIDYECIKKAELEDLRELIFMTACPATFLLLNGGQDLFYQMNEMGLDLYLEVMPHCTDIQKKTNELCLGLNKSEKVPLIATNDCHYVMKEQWKVQEVLLAIQRKDVWSNPKRWKFGLAGLHLRSSGEMIDGFDEQNVLTYRQYYTAMMNTSEIVQKCFGFEIPKLNFNLPETKYEKMTPNTKPIDILNHFCRTTFMEHVLRVEWNDKYEERYNCELNMIREKDFARYFLIIYELVEWAKQNNIPVGPGRGSVGGSLIAYLLGITQIDPLKYGLLFERFISADRIDFPDIDIDFADNKCHLIRQHLGEEYGKYNIAGISTFLKLKSKAAIRDVGRVFELPAKDVDEFAKSIRAGEHEDGIIANAIQNTKEGDHFNNKYPEETKMACALEGQAKAAGQHPAGLIISADDLRCCGRTSVALRSKSLVVNWDMDDCEYAGLIKIDALKLGTLTVLDEAKRLIKEDFEYEKLPLDDPKVYEMLSDGETAGVFQLSGYDCQRLCIEMGVDNFEDIPAIVSLARPGPKDSGMTELYIRRKKGEKWEPLHPLYEEITKHTYCVMVYQEQMMQAMVDLAGFSNSDADRIRKVIGKKRKAEEFEPYRESFLKGCKEKKTLTEDQANEFWKGLLEWAHYGFNRSHAVAYGILGYQTAWLKANHPVEFYCAQLTYGTDKENILKDAQNKGYQIVTPKVGISDSKRWIAKDNKLYMPFVEIKGIGEKEAEKCCNAKKKEVRKGFFNIKESHADKIKVEKLLHEVKAFDLDPKIRPDDCLSYFQFDIGENACEYSPPEIEILIKRFVQNDDVLDCRLCQLREQADRVVPSSTGIYNALALGEGPGCISGDSYIDTAFRNRAKFPNGIKIKDLVGKNNFYVYSFDVERNELVLGEVKRVWKTGRKKVYRVVYEWFYAKGKNRIRKTNSVKVTSNHQFLLRYSINKKDPFKGIKADRRYLSIEQGLMVGHSLQPFNRIFSEKYHRIGAFSSRMKQESRFLLEQKIGRKLANGEQCHHDNENKQDDSYENLILHTIDSHARYHTTNNNPMFNDEIKKKHSEIMKSDRYRNNLSRKMKEVLKDPKIYAERLEQISKSKYKIAKTVKNKFDTDPNFYWNYLMGRKNSPYFNYSDERIIELFRKRFPGIEIPIGDNHKIISIEYIGEEDVYDMEVEKYHNFAVNGIFVHNSDENLQGIGWIGDAGKRLWKELGPYGITRRMIHLGNCVKCFPSKTKTPSKKEIDLCFNKWMLPEILSMDCRLILACGNIPLYALTGRDKGIQKLSGEMEWVEKVKAWVVFSVHPSAVLRSPRQNLGYFQKGIERFSNEFNRRK